MKNYLIRVEEKDFVYFRVDAESLGEAKFIASSKDFYKSLNVSQEEAIKNRELPTYKDYEVLAVYECDDEMIEEVSYDCLLYTSPSPRDKRQSRMPSSA